MHMFQYDSERIIDRILNLFFIGSGFKGHICHVAYRQWCVKLNFYLKCSNSMSFTISFKYLVRDGQKCFEGIIPNRLESEIALQNSRANVIRPKIYNVFNCMQTVAASILRNNWKDQNLFKKFVNISACKILSYVSHTYLVIFEKIDISNVRTTACSDKNCIPEAVFRW